MEPSARTNPYTHKSLVATAREELGWLRGKADRESGYAIRKIIDAYENLFDARRNDTLASEDTP
jgi:hypothetical protein